MKKFLLFLSLLSPLFSSAQLNETLNEDFEAYKKDDFLGVVNPNRWKVLFNDPGTDADVQVSTEKAKSGTKSIYFFSNTIGGGPQNIYLPLFANDATHKFGTVDFSMWLFIPSNQGAYFDFQAVNPIPEETTVKVYFDNSSLMSISEGNGTQIAFSGFTQNQWIKFGLKADLTKNEWIFLLNDNIIVTKTLKTNALYALSINPQSAVNQSQFYIDDISLQFTQEALRDIDASITPIEMQTRFLAGKSAPIKAQLRNVGKNDITSVELEWSDGLTTKTEMLTNLNLKSLTNAPFTLSTPYIAKQGADNVSLTIKKVNGVADMNPANDYRSQAIDVKTPARNKRVLAEQVTGTWCQWCPRGHVLMEYMEKEYPEYFVGIAVHGSGTDPMRMNNYVAKLNTLGFPEVAIDRDAIVDPYDMENKFFNYITQSALAELSTKVKWTNTARTFTVSPKAVFDENATAGKYSIAVVLAENNVKGNSSAYNQVNVYGTGQFGPMGGYEKLPVMVPFTQMVYKHVARALLNNFEGEAKTFATIKSGDEFIGKDITYTVSNNMNLNELEIITILLDKDGDVVNAIMTPAREFAVSAKEVESHPAFLAIAPNPATDNITVQVKLNESINTLVKIVDMTGKVVAIQDFGNVGGNQNLSVDTTHLVNGIYIAQIYFGDELLQRKFVIGK
jgi:thiol-disulfide isomerase/thioredoxin